MTSEEDVENHIIYKKDSVNDVFSVTHENDLSRSHILDHMHFRNVIIQEKWLCKCDTGDNYMERVWVVDTLNHGLLTEEEYKEWLSDLE